MNAKVFGETAYLVGCIYAGMTTTYTPEVHKIVESLANLDTVPEKYRTELFDVLFIWDEKLAGKPMTRVFQTLLENCANSIEPVS